MNKVCKQCKNEFEQKNFRGSEQLYCSKECSRKSSTNRYKQNLINKYIHDESNLSNGNERAITTHDATRTYNNVSGNHELTRVGEIGNNGKNSFNESVNNTITIGEYIKCVTENASNLSELKYLKEKLQLLEIENSNLRSELEFDNEDESNDLGMFGGIIDLYKKDPTATILFAKDMIFEFLKQPKNASQQATTT